MDVLGLNLGHLVSGVLLIIRASKSIEAKSSDGGFQTWAKILPGVSFSKIRAIGS